ncbi:aaa family protein [Cystoisospora suis]|uniref:Aaa family protein n=1 Tax=Cystoisospora suis TaxID=483139 RepID=A0A2C6KFE9_9APIC|nr:aaa family protein [Cystoisospora suis]
MTYLSPHAASTRDTSVTSQRGYLASSSSFFLSGDEELPCHLDVYPPTSRLIYGRKGMIGLDGRYDGWRREEEKETTFFEKPRERGVPSFSSSPPPSVSCCCCLSIAEMYVSPLFVRPIASILHLLFSKHEELLFDSLQLLLRRDTLLTSFAFASSSPLKKSSLPSSPYFSSRKIQAFRAPLAFVSPEKKRSHDKEDRDDTRRSLYRDVSVDPGIEDRERKDMKEKSLYISGASLGSGENRSMYKRPTSLGRERHSHHEGDEREAKRKRYSWREQEMEEGDMDREDMNDLERHKKGMDEGFKESSNTSFRSGLVADASTCSSLYEEGGSVSRLTSFSVEPCRPSTQKEEARIIFQQEEEKGERGGEEEEENGDRGEGRRGGEINGEGEEGCGLSVQLNHHPGLRTSCSSFPFSSLPSVSSSSISPPSISFLHSSPSSSLFSFPPACRTPVMPTTPSFLLEGQLAHVYKRVSTVSPRPKWIVLRGGGGGGDRAISGVSSVYGSGGTGGRGRSGEKKEGGEDLEGFPLSVLKRFIVPGLLDALQIESRVDVSPSSLFVGPQSTGPGGTALGDLLQRILSVGSTCIDGRRGAVVLQRAGEHLKNHIGGAGDGEKRREGGKGIGTGRRRDGTGAGGGGGGPSCVHPAACLGEVVLQPPTIEEG